MQTIKVLFDILNHISNIDYHPNHRDCSVTSGLKSNNGACVLPYHYQTEKMIVIVLDKSKPVEFQKSVP